MINFITKYKNCPLCKLSQSRIQVVIGRGVVPAPLLITGEAPGEMEDLVGKPFVGRSGKLLDELLKDMGVKENEYYITNTVLCHPPKNRNPEPDEIEVCRPRLIEHINIINPKVILAVGTFAAQTLSNSKEKISQLRKNNELKYENIPLVCTFHPSFSLRAGGKYNNDICFDILRATRWYW